MEVLGVHLLTTWTIHCSCVGHCRLRPSHIPTATQHWFIIKPESSDRKSQKLTSPYLLLLLLLLLLLPSQRLKIKLIKPKKRAMANVICLSVNFVEKLRNIFTKLWVHFFFYLIVLTFFVIFVVFVNIRGIKIFIIQGHMRCKDNDSFSPSVLCLRAAGTKCSSRRTRNDS